MNDTQILTWVASHISKYTLLIHRAEMEYIDDDGFTHSVVVDSTDGLSDIDILRACVQTAQKNS